MGAFGVVTLLPYNLLLTLRLEPNASAFGMLVLVGHVQTTWHMTSWNNMPETLLMHVGRPVLDMRATACLDKLS